MAGDWRVHVGPATLIAEDRGEDELVIARNVGWRASKTRAQMSCGAIMIVLTWCTVFATVGHAHAADATALVGDWLGRWQSGAGSSGPVYLVIESAQGSEVQGTIFIAVATPAVDYYNRDVRVSGSFDGSELRFWLPPAVWITLKVTGTQMRGSVQGQQTFGTVELDRRR